MIFTGAVRKKHSNNSPQDFAPCSKVRVTVQPRTLHLLQSPYKHVNLAKKESAPRRRRFGMGRFRNREAEG